MSGDEIMDAAFPQSAYIRQEEFEKYLHSDRREALRIYRMDFDDNLMGISVNGQYCKAPLDVMVNAARAVYKQDNFHFGEREQLILEKLERLNSSGGSGYRETDKVHGMEQRM